MRLNSARFVALIGGLAAVSALAAGQQSQPSGPSFRSGVQLVLVDVVVRDKKTGRLVTDLTKTDFEIKDEGKLQAIASFASVSLSDTRTVVNHPAPPAWPVTDRVGSNQRPDGRLIVFFINDPFMSHSDTGYLRDLLHQFVDNEMSNTDQVAIWPLTNQLPRQEFTSDRARLDAVTDRLQGTAGNIPVPLDQLLVGLNGLLSGMERISGRGKVVILLGGEVLPTDFVGTPIYEHALRLAAAANVAIYPISFTGVRGLSNIVGSVAGRAEPLPLASNILADETGGAVANRNNIGKALTRVEEDAGSYYLIGFSPSAADSASDHLRRLTVRARRRDVVVQTRHGYLPSTPQSRTPSADAPFQDGTGDPLPDPELPLRIQAGCFGDGKNGDILVVTLAVDVPHDRLAGHTLEYWVAGVDSSDRIVQTARGASTIPEATSPIDVGVASAIHVPPGFSTVKAVVRVNGQKGSVSLNVDAPRLNEPLAMSDIALAPVSGHAVVTGNPPAFLTQRLPKPVSAQRMFDGDDALAIYGEVYGSRQPSEVTAIATIVDAGGQVQRRVALTVAPVQRASISRLSPVSYSTQLNLRGLEAGAYTLGVKVTDPEGHTNAKGIAFHIRPSP